MLYLCMSRSLAMPIQGDEAGTYLRHVTQGWNGYLNLSTANNHLLNTSLVWISTLFAPFSETAIRLPSLLISAWFFLWYIPKRFTPSSWILRLMFVSIAFIPYYFNEYLSMARGYGMASIFALCSLNELAAFQQAESRHIKLYLTSLFISLSCLSSLTIFPLFIVVNIGILNYLLNDSKWVFGWTDLKRWERVKIIYLIPMVFTLLISTYTFIRIKLSGVATIAGGSESFFGWLIEIPNGIITPLQGAMLGGDFPRLAPSPYLEHIISILILALISYQLVRFFKTSNRKNPWLFGFFLVLISITLIYFLSLIGSYPHGRAWIPYWLPLVYIALTPIFSLNQLAINSEQFAGLEKNLLAISIILSLITIASTLAQFETRFTYELRPFYYQYKSLMHHSRAGTIHCLAYKDINDEVLKFYFLNKEGPIKPLIQCPKGIDSPTGFMQFSHKNKEPFFKQ
ncbi:hypothetical protein MITS9508_00678 [Synechococcus sp. MIT S9508]|nr:hypothetical protein MITS9508_00678 [Synechococcus sp. MIT S9508]